MSNIIPIERVERCILLIRGQKVMLDSDLAKLYQVSTKRLNEQVRRNLKRFPDDFMFQLNNQEVTILRSQFATLKNGRGEHRKYLPYVFTEQGVAMLSSVLNSERAIQVNIEIMRTFVQIRQILSTHKEFGLCPKPAATIAETCCNTRGEFPSKDILNGWPSNFPSKENFAILSQFPVSSV